jgi:hypothetical protein
MTLPHWAIDDCRHATACPAWLRRIGGHRSAALRAALAAALMAALSCGGCGQAPQFSAKDRRLLESLRTAISAHKPDWLEANVKQIDNAHQQGMISDDGFDALQSIIAEARAGDWKQAEKQIIQLEKSQHPPAK